MIINIIYNSWNKPTVGETIVETTAEFAFDNLAGRFSNDCDMEAVVEVEKIGEDYSDYDRDRCNNGGCYGYDFYEIVEVISTNKR